MSSVRINVSFPQEIFTELSRDVEPRKRSRFITEAVGRSLRNEEPNGLQPNTRRLRRRSGEPTRSLRESYPMASTKRGEAFLVNFDPTLGAEAKKTRPAVVVSNDINNAHSPIVSIALITSNVTRIYSFEVEIPRGTGGLRARSKVMINQTRAVDRIRLMERLGQLPAQVLKDVNRALKLHYDLE